MKKVSTYYTVPDTLPVLDIEIAIVFLLGEANTV
jgi:hypothetical protein